MKQKLTRKDREELLSLLSFKKQLREQLKQKEDKKNESKTED